MTTFQDRVRGVAAGVALGDAMGAPVEKLTFAQIQQQYGKVESIMTRWYKADYDEEARLGRMRGDGIVTDDTLMTLALMRVYETERRHLDAYDMGNEFVKEIAFRKVYVPELGRETTILERLFYPEKYIFIRHVLANCEPREGGIGNMVNCGAAMYIAPVGVVNAGDPKAAYDEAILFAMGHQSSYGLEAAGVMAACVARAMEPGCTVRDILDTALGFAKDGTRLAIEACLHVADSLKKQGSWSYEEAVGRLHEALLPYSPMGDDVHRHIDKVGKPSNHYAPSRLGSIEELPMALAFIHLHDGELYPAMSDGVSSGRDTDSIGVMIGAILGAMHGVGAIRREDLEQLDRVNRLDLMAASDAFAGAAREIIRRDLDKLKRREAVLD
jgi:ADP-ribosylglycohydrolase